MSACSETRDGGGIPRTTAGTERSSADRDLHRSLFPGLKVGYLLLTHCAVCVCVFPFFFKLMDALLSNVQTRRDKSDFKYSRIVLSHFLDVELSDPHPPNPLVKWQ